MKFKNWLFYAISRLSDSLTKTPRLDSEILLMFITKKTKSYILSFDETILKKKHFIYLEELLYRRENGEPIAYIIGKKEFWSLKLKVSKKILIPRPDTELLVTRALDIIPPCKANILDLGTGSGAISLALAYERPMWNITGVDIISDAIYISIINAKNLGINNVNFYKSNWFKNLNIKYYNLIISNPPYLKLNYNYFKKKDIKFEPKKSLISKLKGFKDLIKICLNANRYLINNGWLLIEHGYNQGKTVRTLLKKANFNKIKTFCDYGHNERISQGKFKYKI
ncbi:MAG: peptide chain release factor N(5)-glutamine methyltransferase [Enterobacterales bacterium]